MTDNTKKDKRAGESWLSKEWAIVGLGLSLPFIILTIRNLYEGNTIPSWLVALFHDVESLGTVGDWLGGSAAPLLNFAAFIILYKSLKYQREDFMKSREEFNKSIEEQKNSQFLEAFNRQMSILYPIIEELKFIRVYPYFLLDLPEDMERQAEVIRRKFADTRDFYERIEPLKKKMIGQIDWEVLHLVDSKLLGKAWLLKEAEKRFNQNKFYFFKKVGVYDPELERNVTLEEAKEVYRAVNAECLEYYIRALDIYEDLYNHKEDLMRKYYDIKGIRPLVGPK